MLHRAACITAGDYARRSRDDASSCIRFRASLHIRRFAEIAFPFRRLIDARAACSAHVHATRSCVVG